MTTPDDQAEIRRITDRMIAEADRYIDSVRVAAAQCELNSSPVHGRQTPVLLS